MIDVETLEACDDFVTVHPIDWADSSISSRLYIAGGKARETNFGEIASVGDTVNTVMVGGHSVEGQLVGGVLVPRKRPYRVGDYVIYMKGAFVNLDPSGKQQIAFVHKNTILGRIPYEVAPEELVSAVRRGKLKLTTTPPNPALDFEPDGRIRLDHDELPEPPETPHGGGRDVETSP